MLLEMVKICWNTTVLGLKLARSQDRFCGFLGSSFLFNDLLDLVNVLFSGLHHPCLRPVRTNLRRLLASVLGTVAFECGFFRIISERPSLCCMEGRCHLGLLLFSSIRSGFLIVSEVIWSVSLPLLRLMMHSAGKLFLSVKFVIFTMFCVKRNLQKYSRKLWKKRKRTIHRWTCNA